MPPRSQNVVLLHVAAVLPRVRKGASPEVTPPQGRKPVQGCVFTTVPVACEPIGVPCVRRAGGIAGRPGIDSVAAAGICCG
eukprot:5306346-Prymnesium_polylepis.1